ncbi:DUF6160 family protein [Massilia sp. Root335]|jgi:hypothetical protein|uniref:DUF6160 family protein n=1 Tax=Massilia sp. Root335 TaxID=1736517 RepID=UPI000700A28F|nr:DUF6160 family protein [Massilia sp. Root335]KQV49967.1 hypothetical protein ASC93_10595 [Massilia sp. Root335]
MKLLKQLAVVAALSSIASYASALTPIADADLSKVSGRDGVSIAADLHVNIGSFVYTDTDTTGGSVSFNNIKISGAIAATIDIVNNATFQGEVSAYNADGSVNANTTLGVISPLAVPGASAGLAAFQPTGDVVKIAIPQVDTVKNLSMSVDSIKMGNSTASYGSFAVNDIKLQGTTVYIWAH